MKTFLFSVYPFSIGYSKFTENNGTYLEYGGKFNWSCHVTKFQFDGAERCHNWGDDKTCDCVETNVGNKYGFGLIYIFYLTNFRLGQYSKPDSDGFCDTLYHLMIIWIMEMEFLWRGFETV